VESLLHLMTVFGSGEEVASPPGPQNSLWHAA
jgi:hypothetical protein